MGVVYCNCFKGSLKKRARCTPDHSLVGFYCSHRYLSDTLIEEIRVYYEIEPRIDQLSLDHLPPINHPIRWDDSTNPEDYGLGPAGQMEIGNVTLNPHPDDTDSIL
jgi:hypothetical protein